jgi:GTP cyclohydrolase I
MAHPMVVTKSVTAIQDSESGLSEYSTQELYRELITRLKEDPDRDGLLATPKRVEQSMAFLTRGYTRTPLRFCAAPSSTSITTRW